MADPPKGGGSRRGDTYTEIDVIRQFFCARPCAPSRPAGAPRPSAPPLVMGRGGGRGACGSSPPPDLGADLVSPKVEGRRLPRLPPNGAGRPRIPPGRPRLPHHDRGGGRWKRPELNWQYLRGIWPPMRRPFWPTEILIWGVFGSRRRAVRCAGEAPHAGSSGVGGPPGGAEFQGTEDWRGGGGPAGRGEGGGCGAGGGSGAR